MKFPGFLQHLPRFQRITGISTDHESASIETVDQRLSSTAFSAESFTRCLSERAHWLANQSVQQLRHVMAHAATFFAPPALSLAEAAHILEGMRQQPQTPEGTILQGKAFARLHKFLQRQPVPLQAGPLQPLLMLMASCLARLPDLQQRTQALMLIEVALRHTPQLALAETLTMQLWGLPGSLIPRAFDAIDGFLQHGCIDPRSQIDILLELTDVMQIPSCRQRARVLLQDGLRRLDAAPCLRKRIESRLALSDIGAANGQWHRFDA